MCIQGMLADAHACNLSSGTLHLSGQSTAPAAQTVVGWETGDVTGITCSYT